MFVFVDNVFALKFRRQVIYKDIRADVGKEYWESCAEGKEQR